MTDYYALIPAAGHGSRMGEATPKQYLELLGRPLIHHAIARLCGCPRIKQVYVVLAADDEYWQGYDWTPFAPRLTPLFCGGSERFESVRNGLAALSAEVDADDWVLIHDAARPGLSDAALTRLIEEAGADKVGGLLAVPLADTLKRADAANRVAATEPRAGLWQAQTPQMFRHATLLEALTRSVNMKPAQMPTDEAQAIESMGLNPKLVLGDGRNFKVTWPQDLELAALMLSQRGDQS